MHKWKSMDTQIFGLFINLLFVFPLCPCHFFRFTWMCFVRSSFGQTFAIYGFDKWKFQSSKKCAFFRTQNTFPPSPINMHLCLLFLLHFNVHFERNNFHLKWTIRVLVTFYLFCAFNRFWAWLQNNDNVYSNILSKYKYWLGSIGCGYELQRNEWYAIGFGRDDGNGER